jgi:hypothetical protein
MEGQMVSSRPVLKELSKETDACQQDSARQSEKAKSKPQLRIENGTLRRQELQQYVEKIFRTIENVLEIVKRERATQRNKEIRAVHLQMEAVRVRLDESIARLEALIERNLSEV